MAAGQVRVGILADSMTQPRWVRHMLERILAEANARFDVVVLNGGSGEDVGPPTGVLDRIRRYWRVRRQLLFIAFKRFDHAKFRTSPDAFEMVDVSDLLEEGSEAPLRAKPWDPALIGYSSAALEEELRRRSAEG